MTPTPYDTTPEQALSRLRALPAGAAVVVDLDETLLLDGSVERFLGSARPALLAQPLLLLLDILKPWNFLGGARHRDLWRVRLIATLFPWTWHFWRRAAARIAEQQVNRPLLDALAGKQLALITLSYRPIAAPIAAALLPGVPLVACALNRQDRDAGKPALMAGQLPDFPLAQATAISDSSDDQPLLAVVAQPLRVVWPQARVTPAFEGHYLPLLYTRRLRRPGRRYFLRCVLQEDFAFFLLAALPLAISLPYLVAGLSVLLLSFWCVYEQGYVDNDRMAARFEPDNPRPPSRGHLAYGSPHWQAGLWALVLALPGCWLTAQGAGAAFTSTLVAWLGVLAVTTLWYALYNRVDPPTRLWLFPGLQALRAFGMAAVAASRYPAR